MDDRGRLLLASLIIDERPPVRDPISCNARRRPICAPGMDRVRGGVIIHARTGHGPRFVPVAQLDRASASGAEGYRFDSCRGYSPTSLAEREIRIPIGRGWRGTKPSKARKSSAAGLHVTPEPRPLVPPSPAIGSSRGDALGRPGPAPRPAPRRLRQHREPDGVRPRRRRVGGRQPAYTSWENRNALGERGTPPLPRVRRSLLPKERPAHQRVGPA